MCLLNLRFPRIFPNLTFPRPNFSTSSSTILFVRAKFQYLFPFPSLLCLPFHFFLIIFYCNFIASTNKVFTAVIFVVSSNFPSNCCIFLCLAIRHQHGFWSLDDVTAKWKMKSPSPLPADLPTAPIGRQQIIDIKAGAILRHNRYRFMQFLYG